jgi:hypothetical protein
VIAKFGSFVVAASNEQIQFMPDFTISSLEFTFIPNYEPCLSGYGYRMRFCLISIIFLIHSIPADNSGIELIKNGSFENDAHWGFATNGDALGKSTSQNGICVVTVTNPGAEDWFIQLTQNNLYIKKDLYYTFSFEISASTPRKIVTSICKNGDPYSPYSKRDSLNVDTTFFKYTQIFQMKQITDTSARVEFNFGKYAGDVKLKHVSIVESKEPEITISRIEPQNIAISGEPVRLYWRSLALKGPLKLSISYDNGVSWSIIDSSLAISDSFVWIPGTTYSPWCLFKLSTPTISTVSSTPLQIVPKVDLIKNGSFSNLSHWTLSPDSLVNNFLKVSTDSGLSISCNNPFGKENAIILSQVAIHLDEKKCYDLFFTCSSKSSSVVRVALSNSILIDSLVSDTADFSISEEPTRFQARFLSQKTQSDGRLTFLLGSGKNDIFIDDISLITLPDTVASNRVNHYSNKVIHRKVNSFFTSGNSRCPFEYPCLIIDLSGRKVISYLSDRKKNYENRSSGIIIAAPKMNKYQRSSNQK